MGVKPTSIERTLGSTGGNKFRHILFIIIESAMALFAIQLVRVVLGVAPWSAGQESSIIPSSDCVIVIHQMLNVIILFISTSVWLIEFTWIGHRTNNNFGAGSNETVLR